MATPEEVNTGYFPKYHPAYHAPYETPRALPWLSGMSGHITALCVLSEDQFAIGHKNGSIKFFKFDGEKWQLSQTIVGRKNQCPEPTDHGHENQVMRLQALPDGRLLSAGLDGRIIFWAPNGGGDFAKQDEIIDAHFMDAHCFSANKVAASTAKGTLNIFEKIDGQWQKISLDTVSPGMSICVAPPGNLIAVGTLHAALYLFEFSQDQGWHLAEKLDREQFGYHAHHNLILCLDALSPDFIVTGGLDKRIIIWERVFGKWRPTPLFEHSEGVFCVRIINKNLIISGACFCTHEDALLRWERRPGEPWQCQKIGGGLVVVHSFDFFYDRKMLIAGPADGLIFKY